VDRIGDTFRWKGENVSTQQVAEAVGGEPGVALCAAYGVALPGAEGRAGMAAVVLDPGAALDGARLYARIERELPAYARPVFLRIGDAPELTGTFKLKKTALQQQGFDPAATSDPILYRDDERRAYQPLDASTHERIATGALRF
jgi:fatty-acyl-CoA synthase